MKVKLTAVSTGPGEADIIAHIPPLSSTRAGWRARVARAVRQGDPGTQWTATLYAKAYPLSEGEPSVPATMATVHSAAPPRTGRHTLHSIMHQLSERGIWWTA